MEELDFKLSELSNSMLLETIGDIVWTVALPGGNTLVA
jgi:hypothetical protein